MSQHAPFQTTLVRHRRRPAAAALAALAIVLTACGTDGDATTSPTDDQGITAPAPGGSGDGAAGGTRPSGQEFTTQERVDMLLGSTQEQAENLAIEFGWTVRVGRIDDEQFMLTEDYQIGRMTVELDTEAGVAVVTSVTVELDGGPETFTS